MEKQSGRVHLTQHFLTFISLDRRALKVTLPLQAVRRVEKLGTGSAFNESSSNAHSPISVGVYALGFDLCHGGRMVLQLNALKHTCDQFALVLRTNLKACLPRMKTLKDELGTFYSEYVMGRGNTNNNRGTEELISFGADDDYDKDNQIWTTKSGVGSKYHGGLCVFYHSSLCYLAYSFKFLSSFLIIRGLIFKYPGDPKMFVLSLIRVVFAYVFYLNHSRLG